MDNAGDGARRYGALAMAEVTDSAGNKTILAASNGRDGAIYVGICQMMLLQ